MVVVPFHYLGRQATFELLVAGVIARNRRLRGQSQSDLGALVGLSRHEVGRREANAVRPSAAWSLGQMMLLDQAWQLPVGSLAEQCLEAFNALRQSLSFVHPEVARRPLTVEQFIGVLDYLYAHIDDEDAEEVSDVG